MTIPGDAQKRIDAYLARLRQMLRGMNREDARDILEELSSHITEKAAATGGQVTASGVDDALARLGSPEDLASQYLTDALLARAEVSRSPLRIIESLFRWASLSFAGFIVLLGSIAGYFIGGALILSAALKPFHPQTAGLWIFPEGAVNTTISLRLGFGNPPADGRELLGWFIVPAGLVLGCGLVTLTTRSALWCIQLYRKSRILPRG